MLDDENFDDKLQLNQDRIEESKKKYTSEDIKTKFVIMTAYSSEHILDKASFYQCKIINKPFNILNDQTLNEFLE